MKEGDKCYRAIGWTVDMIPTTYTDYTLTIFEIYGDGFVCLMDDNGNYYDVPINDIKQ